MPLPDGFSSWRDLPYVIAVHNAVVFRSRLTSLNPFGRLTRHWLPAKIDRVSVGQPAKIMMLRRITILPHNPPLPVMLAQKPAFPPSEGWAILRDRKSTRLNSS